MRSALPRDPREGDSGAVDQALADADTFFDHELPALRQWSFGPEEARRVRQPVLAVVGEKSDARFQQRQKLLLEWLPNVEPFVLPVQDTC